jgi:hypothetical protein
MAVNQLYARQAKKRKVEEKQKEINKSVDNTRQRAETATPVNDAELVSRINDSDTVSQNDMNLIQRVKENASQQAREIKAKAKEKSKGFLKIIKKYWYVALIFVAIIVYFVFFHSKKKKKPRYAKK